jgi:hypothetical protein
MSSVVVAGLLENEKLTNDGLRNCFQIDVVCSYVLEERHLALQLRCLNMLHGEALLLFLLVAAKTFRLLRRLSTLHNERVFLLTDPIFDGDDSQSVSDFASTAVKWSERPSLRAQSVPLCDCAITRRKSNNDNKNDLLISVSTHAT